MIDPHLQHVPRLGRHPSRFRLAGTPVITVMLGSALTLLYSTFAYVVPLMIGSSRSGFTLPSLPLLPFSERSRILQPRT